MHKLKFFGNTHPARTRSMIATVLILLFGGLVHGEQQPVAMSVAVDALGAGPSGTVMGIVVQIAPEDRERLGERQRAVTTLLSDNQLIDRQDAVVALEDDGTVMLYREFDPGTYELRVSISSIDGLHSGIWIGDITAPQMTESFSAPEDAPADAVALELSPPATDAVRFEPPPETGGIGALQLEVSAPAETRQVEFFRDNQSLGRRNRAPWTVSVPLGNIVSRSSIRAVAFDSRGNYLGEDSLVLNNPTGRVGVEILFAPEESIRDGMRTVTVSVTSTSTVHEVTLSLDDRAVARWATCPCIVELPVADLSSATIIAADAIDAKGNRGDAVTSLTGGGSFGGTVEVELVEVPITVFDASGTPVTGLTAEDFVIFEDGREVSIEGFGTTEDLSLSLALAVDTSGSMTEIFADVRQAISSFVRSLLGPEDETVLLSFSWDAIVQAEWTNDEQAIETRLERVVPEGGTSLHDAVVRSLEQFRGRRGRQALVMLTDGEDTTSRTDWSVAERFVHTMRIPIFPIGLGVSRLDFQGRSTLEDLAEETGGEAFFPKEVEELDETYARIGTLLRSQYLIWYSSKSAKPPTEFRSIEVQIRDPEYQVRTIRGYYPGR